jgi:DNA-binding transcriptional LysR family regulator
MPARDRWMGVEIRHLEALAAIAREGSFRGAAHALGYVQSAISQQLAQLERLVEARLVDRSPGNGPLELTDAGRVLLDHAEDILARYERAHCELAALADGRAGALRVGMPQSVATRLLPQLLPPFLRRCPGVQLVPTESASDATLAAGLYRGELDLAFCDLPLGEGPLDGEHLMEDPIVLMVAAGAPLARRADPASVRELDGEPLIAYGGWRGQPALNRWLEDHGVTPRIAFRSDHNATVQGLVAAGMGVALAPLLAVDPANERTVAVRLRQEPPARTLMLAWNGEREPSPAALAFREIARTVCRTQETTARRVLQPA